MAILGMRGTGAFPANTRPESWREMILYEFPAGEAPLTALTSMLPSRSTNDPEFHYAVKGLHSSEVTINGAVASGSTALVVDAGHAQRVREGYVLRNMTTGEVMIVTADPTTTTGITVKRGVGTTAAAAIADNEVLTVIGSAYEEGARSPQALVEDETWFENYTQIFREPVELTRTAAKTALRINGGDPRPELQRQALERISIHMEKTALLGQKYKDTRNGQTRRFTGGLLEHIETNADSDRSVTVSGGNLTFANWNYTLLPTAFAKGSPQKLCLIGGHAYGVLEEMFEGKTNFDVVAGDEAYGLRLKRWITGRGEIMFYVHPLMTQDTSMTKMAFIIDPSQYTEVTLDELSYIENRESNDEDGIKDEFLAEIGFEWGVANTHMVIKNINAFSS